MRNVVLYNHLHLIGIGKSWISNESLEVDARCTYSISLTMTDAGNASQPIMIDSIVLLSLKEDTVAYSSLGRFLLSTDQN